MQIINCTWFIQDVFGAWPSASGDVQALPPLMRRRLTPLGRKAIETAASCIDGMENNDIPWIVSCRNGDASRRIKMLTSLAKGDAISPTDFSMSVHNAMLGMFSIAQGNKNMHSALAGGADSFENGLLEAMALLMERGGSVGYLYYDHVEADKLLDHVDENEQIICVCMILGDTKGEIKVDYMVDQTLRVGSDFNIIGLLDYLKSYERQYKIPVAGGAIHFERAI